MIYRSRYGQQRLVNIVRLLVADTIDTEIHARRNNLELMELVRECELVASQRPARTAPRVLRALKLKPKPQAKAKSQSKAEAKAATSEDEEASDSSSVVEVKPKAKKASNGKAENKVTGNRVSKPPSSEEDADRMDVDDESDGSEVIVPRAPSARQAALRKTEASLKKRFRNDSASDEEPDKTARPRKRMSLAPQASKSSSEAPISAGIEIIIPPFRPCRRKQLSRG